ncbi:NUDIX hydrolase [Brevundimonas sp. 2R-24]|uniref:NUDIX hydrolase n=1 Tax=Peiella sedimenti TaxID=3061083 RepID=A0ABT8SQD7_9CAUL|nr:NUDIX hydrolase [Caulobacteraceae bacterium XZ-24]
MAEPFDPAADLADAPRTAARLRPKDAATLILVRRGKHPAVLMGRRAAGHVFMASKWVFPGGRLDRSDFRCPHAGDPDPASLALLSSEVPPHRARALMLAAVRETWEETGLLLARKAPPAVVAGPWRGFRALGALPHLQPLRYVARAITPPGRTRRFDARFFMADAGSLLDDAPTQGAGELDEIAWVPLDQTGELDLPAITRFVIGEVRERLSQPDRAVPFVRFVRGRHQMSWSGDAPV